MASIARGELANLVQTKDWSSTPVGARDEWPTSLKTTLELMLGSRFAMWLGWGPELTFFYNDKYRETLAEKHPQALGRRAEDVWAEIWPAVGPRVDHVLRTGEATWDEGLLLFLERSGFSEETYHTFSYSPAPGDDGKTAGLFCVVTEETERVIGERRLELLRALASALSTTKTRADVFAAFEKVLSAESRDFPFSLMYVLEGSRATLVARSNIDGAGLESGGPWPLALALSGGKPVVVDLPRDRAWPMGPWKIPPTRAALVPISEPGREEARGVFVAALNPHRPIDAGTLSFAQLFVGQLAASLSNASAYEEAQQRAEALAEIDRAKTAFFSNVSHEFRTPLTLMIGPTEDALAAADRALTGEALEVVYRNELRLLKLVNTLLDFARMEAGRVEARFQPTDLATLTADLASAFRSAMERGGLRYDVHSESLAHPVYVDRDMWEKIVLNLLSNALKFTLEGSVRVALREVGSEIELEVADTGAGVAPEQLPRLFERFHRIEGTRARTHEGTGIGLALVRDLVELHGGRIDVTSELGRGTTFRVRIPLGTKHLAPDRIDESAPREHAPARTKPYVTEALRWLPSAADEHVAQPGREQLVPEHAARVLVVDDNADMRDYLARLLRQHWIVDTASDGQEALESIQAGAPDLVLSDVMMPRLDGFGLVQALRSDPTTATIPIMLLSARAGEEAIAEGLRSGADEYLVKPFSASTLVVRVEALLAAARVREALRKSAEGERARLQAMFDESPAAMCVLRGRDLVLEHANDRCLELWGKSRGVLGLPLLEAVPEIRGQGFDALLHTVLDSGVAHHGREVLARIDRLGNGTLVDVFFDFVYAPLPSSDGSKDRVFVHAFDVTELVNARRAAEEANRMKDEFVATMSHELRTPLNAVLGWATLLRSGRPDEATREKALETIERNARAQARLVDDILDVSRIVSGNLRIEVMRVDIATVIAAAIDVIRPAAAAKEIHLDVRIDENAGIVNGDPHRLQQVVWNLLINAVRFTPARGTISISAERTDSQLVITVKDTGVGIPREHLGTIFERFRQIDSSTSRKYGGLGLGLAIVRHLVELHGGSVVAESEGKDQGAMFTVRLPIRAVLTSQSTSSRAPLEDRPTPIAPAGDLEGLRILIVDDDEDSRDLVHSALEAAGARVDVAESANAAYSRVEANAPDVLVSDIGMPGEDGYSLIRRIRALPDGARAIPAVALTAYARREDEQLALTAGYQAHVAKPVEPTRLVATVAKLAGRSTRA